jgi:UDP-glucose 4-epimerase
LVTGGAGFIGAHLTRRLIGLGLETIVLDDLSSGRREEIPQGASFVEASVTDGQAVRAALKGVDVCFHLAAIASVARCNDQLVESHAVNVGGFLRILDAARAEAPYVIYASSAAVYGDSVSVPKAEDGPVQPLSPYGADKLSCELHARAAAEVYGLASTGFRFFNVFGPGQDPFSPYSGVISRFADRLARGERVRIEGDGRQTRDFVYVADVVEGLVAASWHRLAGANVFNLCTASETSILELAEAMAKTFGRPLEVDFAPGRAGDVARSLGSRARFEETFTTPPLWSLAKGLEQLRLAWDVAAPVPDPSA